MNKSEFFYFITGILIGFFIRHFFKELITQDDRDDSQTEMNLPEEKEEITPLDIKTDPLPHIQIRRTFQASRLGDPLTPDEVVFDTKGITFHVKSILSATESFVLYSDISGVEVLESLFFATIIIKPKARGEIKIENFTKRDAKLIKNFITERLF